MAAGSDTKPNPRHLKSWILVLLAVGAFLVVAPAIVVFVFLRPWDYSVDDASNPAVTEQELAFDGDYATSNSVTVLLGETESNHGLRHLDHQSDGLTTIETVDGISARVHRLADHRDIGYFYFQIHPTFKQADVRGARIDVECLDPQPGSLSLHYDALDAEDVSSPRYRQAIPSVRLTGSNAWRTATFRTRNDAKFANRQNGQADFRLSVKAPVLYVRRVTVTREIVPDEQWTGDHSTSNQVSLALGQELPGDGLRHRADESDGRTRIETLDGVTCRHLNRAADNKTFGYLYFALSPSFKREPLTHARVDIEYFAPRPANYRLQFDGIRDEARHKYVTVLPEGAALVKFGPRIDYARITTLRAWTTATFHITNAVFRNGQNGDSDFRIEVVPPDIYVRRVTVSRAAAPPAQLAP